MSRTLFFFASASIATLGFVTSVSAQQSPVAPPPPTPGVSPPAAPPTAPTASTAPTSSVAPVPATAPPASGSPTPAYPPPPPPPDAPTKVPAITVSSPSPGVFLERSVHPRETTTYRGRPRPAVWAKVCELPCTVPLDNDGIYRVDGESIASSGTFHLDTPGDLTVKTGASWKRNLSIVGIGVGGATLVASVALFLRGSELSGEADRIESGPPAGAASASGGAVQSDTTDAPARRNDAASSNLAGFVLLGVGGVVLATSIVSLLLTDGTTVVPADTTSAFRASDRGFAFTF